MKLREIVRFELAYQLRRPWPWAAFAILAVFAFQSTRVAIVPVTLPQDFILNSPFIIASVSVFSCLVWLLVSSAVAGEAAARDVQTGMHPLAWTAPVRRAEYLGGRVLAAFLLNAFILLGVQAGSLLAAHAPGVDPQIVGPVRPAAYLAAYAFIALPNALIATALQFALALWSGRAMAAYLGSILLFFLSFPVSMALSFPLGRPDLGRMTDPLGAIAIMNAMMLEWTTVEKNVRMFTLEGPMLANRLLWTGIALATLGVVHLRFRFAHREAGGGWARLARRFSARAPVPDAPAAAQAPVAVPRVPRSFGAATQVRQALAIAGSSFRMIAASPGGLFLLLAVPAGLLLFIPLELEHWGVPLIPRTDYLLGKHLTAPVTSPFTPWVVVPLFIIHYAGELVWRERDAGLAETVDATPVPEWVPLAGTFLGLGLVLAALMGMLTLAGITVQALMGHAPLEIGRSLQVLFGLQLPEYLLFAMLALAVQAVVNHKHLGRLVALAAYFLMLFAPVLGVEHHLLVYAGGPSWSYSDMRGFGPSLGPWLWFRLYWAGWALLLAVAARLLWVRGREPGLRTRLRVARGRLTRGTAGVAAGAAALVLGLGGFIFYNTNVLNDFQTSAEQVALRAEYERRYGRFRDVPQPRPAAVRLHVEIHPERRAASLRGTYRLVNDGRAPIPTLHLAPAIGLETRVRLDRPVRRVAADDARGHRAYALEAPLQPGDSMTVRFEVRIEPRGFRNGGAAIAVVENGTHFTGAVLPAIGYQPARELTSPDDRRAQGLPRRVTFPSPDDVDPRASAGVGARFEAVVVTDADQVAVAPGVLRRTWTPGGRRAFHYASDAPIGGDFVFASADYAVRRERWNGVEIQVFHDPRHAENVERVVRGARASLDYYSSQFGPYPFGFLQFVETPGLAFGMGVDGSGVVTGQEGFFLLDPEEGGLDVVFEVVAHEVAHQWWGVQLQYAPAEGAIVLSESLAWYSAMQVVKEAKGPAALRRLHAFMREPYPWPPIRTGLPLLRAMDPWAGYRKGPFALYALSEAVGEARLNTALRTLLARRAGPAPTPATTTDLYRELRAVTPDSLRPLLHDLFAANTFWDVRTDRVAAEETATGAWRVTLDVHARKAVADTAGRETEVPMDEWLEVGVFARPEDGGELGAPLYLRRHRIRSGAQRITVTVPRRPWLAGIDPHHLLDWIEDGDDDNVEPVEVEG